MALDFDGDSDPDTDPDRKKVEVTFSICPASFQPEAVLVTDNR